MEGKLWFFLPIVVIIHPRIVRSSKFFVFYTKISWWANIVIDLDVMNIFVFIVLWFEFVFFFLHNSNGRIHSNIPSFKIFSMLTRLGKSVGPTCRTVTRLDPCAFRSHRWFSFNSSPFRVGEHIANIENKATPFVLIETSFLTKCDFSLSFWYLVSTQSSSIKALRTVEGFVRKNGGVPLSLGMVDGEVGVHFSLP